MPLAPTQLSAAAPDFSTVVLTWTDNAFNESGYVIERTTDAGNTWSVVATVLAGSVGYTDTNLNESSSYGYRVSATNAAGEWLHRMWST